MLEEKFDKGIGSVLDDTKYRLQRIKTKTYVATTSGEDIYKVDYEYFGVNQDGIVKLNDINLKRVRWENVKN